VRRFWVAGVGLVLLLGGCTSGAPDTGGGLLARHGLAGQDAAEIIDRLDRLGLADRPEDLMASVRPDELLLSDDAGELTLDVPEDSFYLSVAPYVTDTHECFHHSLTTCQGELPGEQVQVTVTAAATGEVLVDEETTTFANGFVGLWLPRDVAGTLRISHDGRTAETEISTGTGDPTCLTTLQLA
jgi:hypothetical protein